MKYKTLNYLTPQYSPKIIEYTGYDEPIRIEENIATIRHIHSFLASIRIRLIIAPYFIVSSTGGICLFVKSATVSTPLQIKFYFPLYLINILSGQTFSTIHTKMSLSLCNSFTIFIVIFIRITIFHFYILIFVH